MLALLGLALVIAMVLVQRCSVTRTQAPGLTTATNTKVIISFSFLYQSMRMLLLFKRFQSILLAYCYFPILPFIVYPLTCGKLHFPPQNIKRFSLIFLLCTLTYIHRCKQIQHPTFVYKVDENYHLRRHVKR